MSHRVSIVVNSTSATSRLKVEAERPKFARKPAASQNQSFQKNVCTALFLYSWTMRRVYLLSASRALCHILCFFLGSTLNSGAHARTKHSTQSGVSVHFFLLFFYLLFLVFFLPTHHSQSSVTVVCVCELQAADEKIWLANIMCFRGRHSISAYMHGERMFEKHAQIHAENRTCQVPVHPP